MLLAGKFGLVPGWCCIHEQTPAEFFSTEENYKENGKRKQNLLQFLDAFFT